MQTAGLIFSYLIKAVFFLLIFPLFLIVSGQVKSDSNWQDASHASAGIAPDPATNNEAIIQIYAARAFSLRGAFGVHTWIAAKGKNADKYTRYEVIGWNVRREKPALSISSERAPDARWYNAEPWLISDIRGEEAEKIIAKLDETANAYPYKNEYRMWPGPNSNSFIAYMGRNIPEMRLDLPPLAIGKDYIADNKFFAPAPSGTGYQLSLFGIFSILIAKEEGLEINLLSLTIGIDFNDFAIKLPGIGRVG